LSAIELGTAPKTPMQAGGMQSFLTENAGSIGPSKRRGDQIANLNFADIRSHSFDDANELVSHAATSFAGWHSFVGPEVTAANGSTGDDQEGVGWFNYLGVGNILYTNVASPIHNSCTHCYLSPVYIVIIYFDVLVEAYGSTIS
jgi:hypothetical protein